MAGDRKVWRVYWNRIEEAPQVWSVDQGDVSTEINVQWVGFSNVIGILSAQDLKNTDARKPTGWFQFEARAVFGNGGVMFYGE